MVASPTTYPQKSGFRYQPSGLIYTCPRAFSRNYRFFATALLNHQRSMHFNVNVLTVTAATVATLWLSADAAIIPDSLVRRSTAAEPALNIPDLIPQSVVHGGKDDRRWSTRLRDTVVGKLFGTADRHGRRREQHKYLSQMSKIISQYDGDVVLRFNLSSPEEGKALAEASNILYLDVWSTTKTHADIRMAEAMVRIFLSEFHGESSLTCWNI